MRFHNKSVHPEAIRQWAAYVDLVESFRGKVENRTAIGTNEMMVRLVIRLQAQ